MGLLTPAQLATVKANILASPDLSSQPAGPDGAVAIQKLYNLPSSPAFIVYKTLVALNDVGQAFNGTELAGLTTGNTSRLQAIAAFLLNGVNPSRADTRQFFADVFSGAGGTVTRANLDALWRRTATRFERLLATGTGTTVSPGFLTWEGPISYQDIQEARES
jgi:hypothetical protein